MSSTATSSAESSIQFLSGGDWRTSASHKSLPVFNPSAGRVIARAPVCTPDEVNATVIAAAEALPAWAETPVVDRVRVLFRYRELLREKFEQVAECVTREHGKTIAESRASLQRGLEVIEFACGIPSLIAGDALPNIARNVDCESIRFPVGVCVGITPFNFPAMVPMWMFPIALACGNTFILKPSEKVPLTSNMLGHLLLEAGVPKGVFNILHGDRTVVDALLTHPLVRAISFVGSTAVAKYIYETGTAHGKRVQAAGGAKNHIIVMPDADLGQAAEALKNAAFGCAGERCMAGSIAMPVGEIAPALVDKLCQSAAAMTVGPTSHGQNVDMGPLISAEHRDRVAGYLDIAAAEGAHVALDGRKSTPPGDGFLLGPSIVDQVTPGMRLAREEIFGPVLSVVRARSLEEALAVTRSGPYGNGASLFTRSGWAARQFKHHVGAGMVGINVSVPAPMAWFPFTGWNQSFFGDLHMQGKEGIAFYTQQKVTLTRWFESADESAQDPVWQSRKSG